jgi:hypothetical protein
MSDTWCVCSVTVRERANCKPFSFLAHLVMVCTKWEMTRSTHLPWARYHNVSCFVLVSKRVASDDDGFGPAGHQPRDRLADDWLPEHRTTQDVSDGPIRAQPHLLQFELCNKWTCTSAHCSSVCRGADRTPRRSSADAVPATDSGAAGTSQGRGSGTNLGAGC